MWLLLQPGRRGELAPCATSHISVCSVRTTVRQWYRAAAGGLPGVFWTVWWGLVINRLAIYLVRERGFSPAQAGRVLALYGAGMTISGPLGGLLADRIGRRSTMLLALLLGATAVGGLAFARDPAML